MDPRTSIRNPGFRLILATSLLVLAGVSVAGAGDLLVNNSSRYSGDFGLQVVVDDTTETWLRDDSPVDLGTYVARFYVRLDNVAANDGDSYELFSAYDSGGVKQFSVLVTRSGGQNLLSVTAREDGGSFVSTAGGSEVALRDGWHAIEVAWAASSGSDDGELLVTVDNRSQSAAGLAGLDNDTSLIDFVELGATEGTEASTTGSYKADDFDSRISGPIGMISAFGDVGLNHFFWDFIHSIWGVGITSGCTTSEYCPNNPTTRRQMAVFLLRGAEGGDAYTPPPCSSQMFDDVPCNSLFAAWINELFARGITSGCDASNYCPTDNVTRRQMAVFLLRAAEGGGYTPPACTTPIFDDVPCGALFADWINELSRRGITSGCDASNYCPTDNVTRGEMAVFLARTFGLDVPARN